MKKLCLAAAFIGTLFAFAADPFSPGGVAVDWSQYDPKPKVLANTVNLLKNGSFEMPGTDMSGWRGKGHWVGWAHVHSSEKTPQIKALQALLGKSAIRKASDAFAAEGKFSAFIKTPDAIRDAMKPLPMISNKIRQEVPLKPEKKERLYRLVFMAKGLHTATYPHAGALVVQMRGQKLNARKRFQGVGSGVQGSFKLRSDWTQHTVDLQLPANCDGVSVTLILYGVGEAYLDNVQLFPADALAAKPDRVQVRISPYALLDNTYCIGEKLPGVMNFAFHADESKTFPKKNLKLELALPEGFRVADVRDICKLSGGRNCIKQSLPPENQTGITGEIDGQ